MKRTIMLALPGLLGLLAPALSSCAYSTNPTTAENCPAVLSCEDGEIPMAGGNAWWDDDDGSN